MREGRLALVPLGRDEANAFVEKHHRHHGRVQGCKFACGAALDGRLRGVAIVGRPVSKELDDGWTMEVVRLASDGTPHVCSLLYAASWRAGRAIGFTRGITYILASEPGTSLKAAGWKPVFEVKGRSWSRPKRARIDKHPTVDKVRWEAPHSFVPNFERPLLPLDDGDEPQLALWESA